MAGHIYKRKQLIEILDSVKGKTLGQVDKNNVFDKATKNSKITGIAGDVIEQSVLGYEANSFSQADLLVEEEDKIKVPVELKTTGLKKVSTKDKSGYKLEAKEPMSITAVSVDTITNQTDFYQSKLWHKMEEMLLVYYLYDSKKTVSALEFSNFVIQGYHFYKFSEEDQKVLQNDWHIVRSFIENIKEKGLNPEIEYPKISKLRSEMSYLDTAPKYPNPPRFRLKRSVVTSIARSLFDKNYIPILSEQPFTSFQELDVILSKLSKKYNGKTVLKIAEDLNINFKRSKSGKLPKQITSMLIARMFSKIADKLEDIEVFNKFDICYKTIILSEKGKKTEDIKFSKVRFDEWINEDEDFADSYLNSFFLDKKFLFAVFKETSSNKIIDECIFLGFKRITFDSVFIDKHVKKTWETVRELVSNKLLKREKCFTKDGKPIMNKTGIQKETINLPKSNDFVIFLRGSGKNSNTKPLTINGLDMYTQYFWIRGTTLVKLLNKVDYI